MDFQQKENKGALLLLALCCLGWGLVLWGIFGQKYFLAIGALITVSLGGIVICLFLKPAFIKCLRSNSGWAFLGFALACIVLREFLNLTYGGILLFASPFFIILSLAAKIAFAGGLILLCWAMHRRNAIRALIDSLIVALALLVLAWSLHLHPVVQHELTRNGDVLSNTLASLLLLNSLAGIFTLVGAVFYLIVSQLNWQYQKSAPWVLLCYMCLLVVHLVRAYSAAPLSSHPHMTTSLVLICGFSLTAVTLLLMGALWYQPVPKSQEHISDYSRSDFRQRWVVLWFPYSSALGVGLSLALLEARSHVPQVADLLPVVILMIAVVARQLLTMRDNFQLSWRLSEANVNLEQNVMERTQHLATLHSITSTLNSSLDRRSVLKIALEQIMDVTETDVGAIWLRQHVSFFRKKTTSPEKDWKLAYAKGFLSGDHERALRDLTIELTGEGGIIPGSPQKEFERIYGFSPHDGKLLIVPIRSGGVLLGAQALIHQKEQFNYETRALVESVALEVGTSLQNAYLYQDARQRADRDGVTGLYNHRAIQELLAAFLRNSRKTEEPFSVLMMDMDDFKYFNDTYGHPVGDEVLRTVGAQLEKICGPETPIGRYGGDEFIILLPGQTYEQTYKTHQTLLATLQKEHFEVAPGVRIPISLSYGWASFPEDGQNALELITIADANLYRYKERGGYEDGSTSKKRISPTGASTTFGVLDALITAIDNKDHYTRQHSDEVAHYALLIAEELGYSAESLRAVRISALLHDVGKIAVPDDILRHPGKLSKEDWEIMKQHPSFGAMIVKDLPYLEDVVSGIRSHHERWDGKGYPDGLAGNEIPIMGRLLAVPDTYSALTTNRPYRKGLSSEEALFEISRSIHTQFDPQIAQTFIRVMERQLNPEKDAMKETEETTAVNGVM